MFRTDDGPVAAGDHSALIDAIEQELRSSDGGWHGRGGFVSLESTMGVSLLVIVGRYPLQAIGEMEGGRDGCEWLLPKEVDGLVEAVVVAGFWMGEIGLDRR